ncbi:alpha- and gamma-adaptin-binding protein p34 [Hemicordylus capensis]|uniref:alpha- and gamma-adaptin-binding protein p34 n=1 Tax=Hemicordylus capensis TaxID=884348 RepID=UPI0023035BC3|nr:alpha- and gamma-adaptin-binding protein p34 [Hemicordylus capensis]XP_053129202.1 alpha- and gamma-adaptin-binding protein p34 [Hemicordylus capensis]
MNTLVDSPCTIRVMVLPPWPEGARPRPEGEAHGRLGSARVGTMAVPCALITSCAAEFPGEELVKRIIGTEELPEVVSEGGGARFYPWTIDNKYYSADIHLCVVPNKFLVTTEIAESVQAFLVYFDSTTVSGLESISGWLPLVEEWLPEVMILICDRVSENGISRQKAQEWCIQHSFELVELSPEELPDEDDDFPESTGVKRIVQALNANVWSNVVMKNDVNQGLGFLAALAGANHSIGSEENKASEPNPLPVERAESAVDVGDDASGTDGLHTDTIADSMLDVDIQELASLTAGEGDLENFERLFSKLKEMKEKAATLPHEQRKLHAEKVAKAFWMAIGGDRDEIEGLSSDEDN